MIPKQPPRDGQPGFLYLPPHRIHGISVAGEQTTITVPEFDLTFDMGQCTRASLATPLVALSHAHMDHVGGLPYWFSQRHFQKLEGGRVVIPDVLFGQPVITAQRNSIPIFGVGLFEFISNEKILLRADPDDAEGMVAWSNLIGYLADHLVPATSRWSQVPPPRTHRARRCCAVLCVAVLMFA